MATIGQALTAPESGWRRIDNTNGNIENKGSGVTVNTSTTGYHNNSYTLLNTSEGTIIFGVSNSTRLRIIGASDSTSVYTEQAYVKVNGVEQVFTTKLTSTLQLQTLLFEVNLNSGYNVIEIGRKDLNRLYFDAIDIDSDGELRLPLSKAIIKNPSTLKHYSLDTKTLIPLPSSSDKNYLLQDTVSEDVNGLWTTQINRKPLSIKFDY